MINSAMGAQSKAAGTIAMPDTGRAARDRHQSGLTWLRLIASATLAATIVCTPGSAGASLLEGITGTWSGRGRVTFEGGNSEDLSCRAYYTSSSSILSLSIRCASASYKTEIRSKLHLSNGTLAGDWEERSYNAVGSASGVISGNRIALSISGAIEGRLTIDQAGLRQSVNISSNGGGLSSVKIGLTKS